MKEARRSVLDGELLLRSAAQGRPAQEMALRPTMAGGFADEEVDALLESELRTLSPPTGMAFFAAPDGLADFGVARFAGPTTKVAREPTVTLKLVPRLGSISAAEAWVKEHGGRVSTVGGTVLLVELPEGEIAALEKAQSWLLRAEAPRQLYLQLDEARREAGIVDPGPAGVPLSSTFTGKGVIIGILDTGVDWSHDDFKGPGSESRIEVFLHAWQDGDEMRTAAYDGADFTSALRGRVVRELPQGDPDGHGTHCASVAAGNGMASGGRFRGAAPGASLMALRSDGLRDTHILWGIKRMFEEAGQRPAVASLSLATHLGAHDGSSALELELARLCGPGKIVVVAAGNDAGNAIHWQGDLTRDPELDIPMRLSDDDWQRLDVWIPRGDSVDVWVESPDGVRWEPDGREISTVFGAFTATFREDEMTRDQNLRLTVTRGRRNHIWRVRVKADRVVHGVVHAWAVTQQSSSAVGLFLGSTAAGYTLGIPATADRVIAVGSYVSNETIRLTSGALRSSLEVGRISPFSSHGPTRHGAQKPEIAAPGQYVTAALSAGSRMATAEQYAQRHHPDFPQYITHQGTSVAAPFVAGVIALMLERNPKLTPEEVVVRLRATARRDADTGRVWSPSFGFGKIDVEALLQYPEGAIP